MFLKLCTHNSFHVMCSTFNLPISVNTRSFTETWKIPQRLLSINYSSFLNRKAEQRRRVGLVECEQNHIPGFWLSVHFLKGNMSALVNQLKASYKTSPITPAPSGWAGVCPSMCVCKVASEQIYSNECMEKIRPHVCFELAAPFSVMSWSLSECAWDEN